MICGECYHYLKHFKTSLQNPIFLPSLPIPFLLYAWYNLKWWSETPFSPSIGYVDLKERSLSAATQSSVLISQANTSQEPEFHCSLSWSSNACLPLPLSEVWDELLTSPFLQPKVRGNLRGQWQCFRPLKFLQPKGNVFLHAAFYIWKMWLLWLLDDSVMCWHLTILCKPLSVHCRPYPFTVTLFFNSSNELCVFWRNQAVNHIGNWFNKMAFKQSTGRRPGRKAVQLLPAILHRAPTAYFLVLLQPSCSTHLEATPHMPAKHPQSLQPPTPCPPHCTVHLCPAATPSTPGRRWTCIWGLCSWLELRLGRKVGRTNMGQEMQLWPQHCGNLHVGLGNTAASPAHLEQLSTLCQSWLSKANQRMQCKLIEQLGHIGDAEHSVEIINMLSLCRETT